MRHDILQYLAHKIDEDLANIEKDLALGKISDIGDYKFACGRYRGLLNAKNIVAETAQKLEQDDD